jgi:surfactin synthase thioesterase subunit
MAASVLAVLDAVGAARAALVGHSMGALVAFELARELRRRQWAMPAGLILSGARAPQFLRDDEPPWRHDLPTEQLLDVLRSLGGTPPEVLDSPELIDLVLPALRADFKICETYRYISEPPLSASLMVLFGEEDEEVRPDHVAAWRLHTTGEFSVRGFLGDHFFIDRNGLEVGRIVNGFVDRLWAGRPGASAPSSRG